MKIIKNKKILLLIPALMLLSVVAFFLTRQETPKPVENEVETSEPIKQEPSITIDFDGDGLAEKLKVTEKEGIVAREVNMEVFNSNGDKIAELWDGINLYPTTLFKIIKLSENSEKQYLQWNMAVGPHQVETVFLTIVGDMVHPIYSIDFENNTMYTPFYTSRGDIVVEDANGDGLREVIENVDEYPVNAERLDDPEIENMIREEFSKSGFDEATIQSNIDIVSRENYGIGRGRKVIMAIHSFVDADTPFFRRLPSDEYEQIAGPLVAASIDVAKAQQEEPNNNWEADTFLRYSDLEQDSRDFNDFVRDFWTHGRPFEQQVPDE